MGEILWKPPSGTGKRLSKNYWKPVKEHTFSLAVFLENAAFVGEDIAGMTLAVGLSMFKDLTRCILWKEGCVHVCMGMIYVLGV